MSISKIARELKVSKSTVSLVINGKAEQSRISKELEQRILDYVRKIGFKPNALAKSLATGKSRTIGLIVENIGDSFFGPIALRIEACLRSYGYHVLYSSTVGEPIIAGEIITSMLDKRVEGIILSPTAQLEEQITHILSADLPLVVFDRKADLSHVNFVGTDNYVASEQATKHLLDQGYTRIAMITIDSQQSQMLERLQAYQVEMYKHGLQAQVLRVPFVSTPEEQNRRIRDFISTGDFDAIYFTTNYLCIAGVKVLQQWKASKNYGLLSFDDHEVYELLDPSITCIRQPIEEIAQRVVDNLLAQIKQQQSDLKTEIIPSKLIIRGSTLRR